jgi:hypothetical protein
MPDQDKAHIQTSHSTIGGGAWEIEKHSFLQSHPGADKTHNTTFVKFPN